MKKRLLSHASMKAIAFLTLHYITQILKRGNLKMLRIQKTWCTCLTSVALWVIGGTAIAQETPPIPDQPNNITNPANSLDGTIPANGLTNPTNANFLGSGVQLNNNGFSGFPNCSKPVCGYIQFKTSPSGSSSEISAGVILQMGNSSDDIRAEAEKARVEIERIKGDREFSLQLIEKVATAIEAKNCTRARVFAQSLAPIAGYKNHWDYLKDIDAQICMR